MPATTTAPRAFRVLGTTTDVTDCELCGRTDLKGTIVLEPVDIDGNGIGEAVHYGSDCGARAAGWTQRDIRTKARAADAEAARLQAAAKARAASASHDAWSAWLAAQTGGLEVFEAIQQLGGFAKARAAYNAQR